MNRIWPENKVVAKATEAQPPMNTGKTAWLLQKSELPALCDINFPPSYNKPQGIKPLSINKAASLNASFMAIL